MPGSSGARPGGASCRVRAGDEVPRTPTAQVRPHKLHTGTARRAPGCSAPCCWAKRL